MNILKRVLSVLLCVAIFIGVSAGSASAYTVVGGIAEVNSIQDFKAAIADPSVTGVKLEGGPYMLDKDLLITKNLELNCDMETSEFANILLAPESIMTINGSLINNGNMHVFPFSSVIIGSGAITNNGTIYLYDKLIDDGTEPSYNDYADEFHVEPGNTGEVRYTADVDSAAALNFAMGDEKYSEIWVSEFTDQEHQALTIDTGDLSVTKALRVLENDILNITGNLTISGPDGSGDGGFLIIEGTVNVTGNLVNNGVMSIMGDLSISGSGQNYGAYTLYSSATLSGSITDEGDGTHSRGYDAASQGEWDAAVADPNCFAIVVSAGNIVVSSNTTLNSNLRIDEGASLTVTPGVTLTVNNPFDMIEHESGNEVFGSLINNGNLILNNGLEVIGGLLENNGTLTVNGERGIGMGWYTDKDSGNTTYSTLRNTGTIENYSYIGVWDDNEAENIHVDNSGAIKGGGYCFFEYPHLCVRGLSNYNDGWFEEADRWYDSSLFVQPGMCALVFYLYHPNENDEWVYTPVTVNTPGAVSTPIPANEISTDPTKDTENAGYYTNIDISGWDELNFTYYDNSVTYELPVTVDLPELGFYSSNERITDSYIEKFTYTPSASRTFYAIADLPLAWSITGYEINGEVADLISVQRNDNVFAFELDSKAHGDISLNLRIRMQFDDPLETREWDRWLWITEGDYETLVFMHPDNWRGEPGYPVISDFDNAFSSTSVYTSPGGMAVAMYHKHYDDASQSWKYGYVEPSDLIPSADSGISIIGKSVWDDDPNRTEPINDPDYNNINFMHLEFSKFGEFSISYDTGEKTLVLPVTVGLPETGFYNAQTASEESYIKQYSYTPNSRTFYYIANYDTSKCSIELMNVEEGADRVRVT